MNSRPSLILAATIVVFFTVFWFLDSSVVSFLGIAMLLWIGLPLSILAGIGLLITDDNASLRRHWRTCLRGVAAFAGFVAFVSVASHFVQTYAVATAKEYPARVEPLLEAYRQAHGSYPRSLDYLPAKPCVPRLLRNSKGYRLDGDGYRFEFAQPGGIFDAWHYGSRTRTWRLST